MPPFTRFSRFTSLASDCQGERLETRVNRGDDKSTSRQGNLPVDASHALRSLSSRPFLETRLVDVVSTSRSAPDDILFVWFKLHETDGAISIDVFAVAILVFGCRPLDP